MVFMVASVDACFNCSEMGGKQQFCFRIAGGSADQSVSMILFLCGQWGKLSNIATGRTGTWLDRYG